jgi:hypothetical protein
MRSSVYLLALVCGLILGASRHAAAEEIVPRTIIALYNGGDVQNSYIHSIAEMPLNHLGLTVEYHDLHQPLPDIAHRKDVRGVITWFYGDTGLDPEAYLKWAIAAIESGKKYVIIGSLGISETKQYFDNSVLADRFLDRLGIKMQNRWVTPPLNVTYDYKTPEMFLVKAPYEWIRSPYQLITIENDKAQAHLAAHRPNAPADDSAIIITSPTGGYVDVDYAIRSNDRDGNEVSQWMIDPFLFFRLAYATDDLPKPDTTTMAGRRIYYSNIDGDGWNNVTQLEEYRGKKILSSEVVLNQAIRPFPDLPVMVAPIAADIDTNWAGSDDSRRILRALWALPWVEAGSHTYSHPFYWQFFENSDPNLEIPYLHSYKGRTWQPQNIPDNVKAKADPLPLGYIVPRAFAAEPFEIHKEIEGSVKALVPLLPKGKKIEILAWSGNCSPWEEAVRLTREAKVQNLNGGDTRFDPEYPAYASVASIGRQVGKERQIYASTSNENTYTNLWSENFHAFRYLRKTIDNTETPLRLKPFSIYYHMYSGEREASLDALLGNLKYARAQDIVPMTASHFTHIAEGFYDTQLVALGNDSWRVEHRGALATIRFDYSSFKAVNFDRSQGVIGERRFQGSLYVYLDSAVDSPVIALKNDERYYAPPEEATPYLVESRWLISDLKRSPGHLAFAAQGFGKGDMVWQVAAPGAYRVSVNGKTTDVKVAEDRMLKTSIEDNALDQLHITITEAGNVNH